MINWEQEQLDDPESDLCVKVKNVYVDIVLDYKNEWSLYIRSFITERGFTTRNLAMERAQEVISEIGLD